MPYEHVEQNVGILRCERHRFKELSRQHDDDKYVERSDEIAVVHLEAIE